jgi:hypothetical protein
MSSESDSNDSAIPDISEQIFHQDHSELALDFVRYCQEHYHQKQGALDQNAFHLLVLTLRLSSYDKHGVFRSNPATLQQDHAWKDSFLNQEKFKSAASVIRFIKNNGVQIFKDNKSLGRVIVFAAKTVKSRGRIHLESDEEDEEHPSTESQKTMMPIPKPRLQVNLRLVPMFLWYDVLKTLHESSNHFGQEKLWHAVNNATFGIPREVVRDFVARCPQCVRAKTNVQKRNPPSLTQIKEEDFNHRAQVDLIDMQSMSFTDPDQLCDAIVMCYITAITCPALVA